MKRKKIILHKKKILLGVIFFIILLCGLGLFFFFYNRFCPPVQNIPSKNLEFTPNDRILILAPHPDDEVLACGGIIQEAKRLNLPVKICFVTYGDANELSFFHYHHRLLLNPRKAKSQGETRRNEAINAASCLGLSKDNLIFLGYPDLGILKIWQFYWGAKVPYRSILTRAESVPYPDAFRPGALYKGEEVLADLKKVIADFQPTKIFVSHPADQHPDHRGVYLFTQIALWDLSGKIHPSCYTYLVHHQEKRWPEPFGYHPERTLNIPSDLIYLMDWQNYNLTEEQEEKKFVALKAHASQYNYYPSFLSSFIRQNEIFGSFPSVNLEASEVFIPADNAGSLLRIIPQFWINLKKRLYIENESLSMQKKDNSLLIKVKFERPFSQDIRFIFALCGYRNDKPFASLPKIEVLIKGSSYKIYNKGDFIQKELKLTRNFNQVEIKIPLEVLGNPQRILFSGKSQDDHSLFDWWSWRIINL